MRSKLVLLWLTVVFGVGMSLLVQPVQATIILEGSDAIGFHSNANAAAGAYRDQVWLALSGADSRPIAVIGGPVSAGVIGSGTHPISRFSDVAAAGSLSDFVALYFLAGGGCCTENDALITAPGAQAAVSAYLAGGGTVMIENYTGGTAWDFAVGAGGAGNAHVAGVGGGAPSSLGCSDGETVTATGITNGFTQPTPMGCWTHQAYDQSFFGPLGFTFSFFDSPTDVGLTGGPWSSLLSNGFTETGGGGGGGAVPEPSTLMLLGIGLTGLGGFTFARRR